jgi:organic radical activating enzyme
MPELLQHWKEESKELDRGTKIQSCSACWKDEAQGRTSFRQQHGHKNDNVVELWLNNSCNHMCSYCSPKFSSTWQQSIVDHGPFLNISRTAKNNLALPTEAVEQDQWIDYIKEYLLTQPTGSVDLKLLGGEPLMQLRNLQKLVELAGDSINQLEINTNLNPPNNRFLNWLLDTVPAHKLKFSVSLDATPEYNHVPRAGFDPDKFKTNFKLLLDKNINFHLISVVSVLSVFDLPNFLKWSKPYQVIFNKINNPDCLDPILLPKHILDQISSQFEQDSPSVFQELYKSPQIKVDLKLFEQYNYLCQYFLRTNIDPTQISNRVFQQYWNWLIERQK